MVMQLLYGYVEQAWIILWIALVIELLGVAALAVLAIIISMIRKGTRRGHATPNQGARIDKARKFEHKLKKLTC